MTKNCHIRWAWQGEQYLCHPSHLIAVLKDATGLYEDGATGEEMSAISWIIRGLVENESRHAEILALASEIEEDCAREWAAEHALKDYQKLLPYPGECHA
ncbi:MAG: hypothetical protein KQJ78_19565 [Deltaproteobacteria bacterium]|nr:hypothetical protein [Deltaproteobacteria bacterium]